MADHITETLKIMMAQIEEEERALNEKRRAANALSRLLSEPPVYPDVDIVSSAMTTRPDEYYGRPANDVIKTILEKRKKAEYGSATVAEIYQAMVQGGFHFQTENENYAKRGIYSALVDTQFHKLPDGRYGLASWYPTAKTRPEVKERKQKPGRKKKRKKVKPAATATESPQNPAQPKATEQDQRKDSPTSPTTAVFEYVHAHPRCNPAQVVKAIVSTLDTKSSDPEEMVKALIRKMVQTGRLRRVGVDKRELEVIDDHERANGN
jgi:DNA-directed RNA polymerase delta subunit